MTITISGGVYYFDQSPLQANTALVISLPVTLPENRRLRRMAAERGLLPIREEEWDSWNEDTISRFQRKYVFVQDSL